MARALKRKRKPAMNTESEGEAEQLLPAKKFRYGNHTPSLELFTDSKQVLHTVISSQYWSETTPSFTVNHCATAPSTSRSCSQRQPNLKRLSLMTWNLKSSMYTWPGFTATSRPATLPASDLRIRRR